MSYGERSKKFDWFKNSNQVKKSKKDSAKTVWKFVKIFLYISIFVFSLIGCVQSFVIKTSDFSGQGFEIYSSERIISPHVTKFLFEKNNADEFKGNLAIGSAKTIYTLKIEKNNNIFIHESEKDPENGKNIIDEIHKTVGNQSKEKLKMSDAYKGINEGFCFVSEIDNLKTNGKIHKFNDNYAVLSSKSEDNYYNLGGNTDFQGSDIKLWIAKLDSNNQIIGYEQKSFAFYDSEGKNSITYNRAKPRNAIRVALLNTLFSNNNKFYKDFLNVDPTTISTDTKQQQNFNTLQRLAYLPIMEYLGIRDAADKNNSEKVFKVLDNFMIGTSNFGDTDYRPIVEWSSAFGLGPFYGLFVYPVGKLFALIIVGMPLLSGFEILLAIIILVFTTRFISFLLSFKSTMQQTKMQEISSKKAIIDAKYAPYKGNKQMENRKRQEISDLYKKENISPLGAFTGILITIPIFITVWRVISAVQQVKTTSWLGINFSEISYKQLFDGYFQYLPLLIIAPAIQAFSQIYPRLLNRKRNKHQINVYQKAAMKKNNKTANISLAIFIFFTLVPSAGTQIYWIIGGIWQIIQTYVTHKLLHRKKGNKKKQKVNYEFAI